MMGSVYQAYNHVKALLTSRFRQTNNNVQEDDANRVANSNGGLNHRGFLPKLFSLGIQRESRKRVIQHEIEIELTEDEDEDPYNNHLSWSGYRNRSNFPKRFKSSLYDDAARSGEMSNSNSNNNAKDRRLTRGMGQSPAIQESSAPFQKRKNVSEGVAHSSEQTSHLMGNKTDFSSFRFGHPTTPRREAEVITVPDDDDDQVDCSTNLSNPTTKFRHSVPSDRKPNLLKSPQKKPLKKTSNKGFMTALCSVGRRHVDPLNSVIRIEERNKYRDLVQKMTNSVSNPFGTFGRHLQRSKLNSTDLRAVYTNWPNASPQVSLTYGSGISDRVRNDLRLFSTPTASRSPGSTPNGPSSPILIDLEDEEKAQRSSGYADISINASFVDLDDALSSTKLHRMSDANNKELLAIEGNEGTQGSEENGKKDDDDIVILSETLLNKCNTRRHNSLALEQNQFPCVQRSWLDGVSSSFRDRQTQRQKEIQECLETVDVINKESTLEKDLRADIRRKLRVTEIIVLEEPPLKIPDITNDMRIIIDTAKRPGRETDVLAKVFNIDFTRGDVKTLAPSKWLNDNVINAYMELIAQRSKKDTNLPKVHVFTTFFYPKLLKEGYSNPLKRWTRKVDLFEHDLIIFPIHLGLHWCLACADFRNKSIKYYDSLGGRNDKCLNTLLNYLSLEMKERKGKVLEKNEWDLENMEDVPQQQNGSDCGVFTCKFAEYLSRDSELTFVQQNMNYYRDRMIYEIIKNDLMFP